MLFFNLNRSRPISKRETDTLFTNGQFSCLAQLNYSNRQIAFFNIAVRHAKERQIVRALNQRKQIKNFLLNLFWFHLPRPLPIT